MRANAKRPLVKAAAVVVFLMAWEARAQYWQPNASNNLYNTNSGGYVGIGTGTTGPGMQLEVEGTLLNGPAAYVRNLVTTNQSLFYTYGAWLEADVTYNGTSATDESAAWITTRWRGTGSTGSMANKSISAAQLNAFNYNTGTTDWLTGGRFDIRNLSTGTVTNMAGFRVSGPTVSGGTVNNWYGLYLDDPGTPATNTYSIYAAGGNAYFGKNMTIAGDLSVTGNIAAKFQDVAEWVPSPENLTSGTVVTLDRKHANNVVASVTPYDTAVAGVVSDSPGVLLGVQGQGKVKVAATGRVKVRVDASRAPIEIGDLLVASGDPGVAMRSEPVDVGGIKIHRPGTIIGKALEPLASGKGEILVLLSLQ